MTHLATHPLDNRDRVYIETVPTNCIVNGAHGQVTGTWLRAGHVDAVFVKLDDGPMLHCYVSRQPIGERGQWREVISSQVVDRDQFDRIIGADEFRRDCGWRA